MGSSEGLITTSGIDQLGKSMGTRPSACIARVRRMTSPCLNGEEKLLAARHGLVDTGRFDMLIATVRPITLMLIWRCPDTESERGAGLSAGEE
jgi:hypothetical protein